MDYVTQFSTQLFANGSANRMYQQGSCGYRTVIYQSDVTKVKNMITLQVV